jgi:hypothetical protein
MSSEDEVLAAAMDAMYASPAASRPHLTARRTQPIHPATFSLATAPLAPPTPPAPHPAPLAPPAPPMAPPAPPIAPPAPPAAPTSAGRSPAAPPPPTAPTNTENVHLQPFDVRRPSLWFRQAESIFRRKNIYSQIDRYDILLAHIPTDALDAVAPVINTIEDHTTDAYHRLKAKLLSAYAKTDWELANDLYDHPGLGDNKPSQLMNSLLALLPPDDQPGILFLALFMRRLPTYIRDQLAALPTRDPDQLAAHADLIWTSHGGAAAAVNQVFSTQTRPTRPPGRSPTRRQSPSPHRTISPSRWCFYHRKFGDRAQRCQPPCSYRPKNYPSAGGN